MPFISGLRLVREMFDEKVLFAGWVVPLGPSDKPPTPNDQPQCDIIGVPRVEWEASLTDLRAFVKSSPSPNLDLYLREFNNLSDLYNGTFGNSDHIYDGPFHNKMVFGWLYRMDGDFVSAAKRKEPVALLLSATTPYYSGPSRSGT
jgi:hypothetical protein